MRRFGWVKRNWRELVLAGVFLIIGLLWNDAQTGAFWSGYTTRCVTPW